jgi:acetate kinase
MKILVINTGSSSIKYQLFDLARDAVLASGVLERIGEEAGVRDHRAGMEQIVRSLTDPGQGVIRAAAEIAAVGHRVVHGGEAFRRPVLIDEQVLAAIRQNVPLAPLHNPANLVGIEVARSLFPGVPQVAVFDTAFHQTLPPRAFRYGLPRELYERHRIRRYGFHGSSHQYVAKEAARRLGRPLAELNLITIHLGNGASITAIAKGQSVDTSMGMTPLEGLLMGTRSGDLDPSILFHLAEFFSMTVGEIHNLLNQQSGLKGICGENDMREILKRRAAGDKLAALAVEIYTYRIKKYIGAYYAVLGEVDALVFTAGVGENAPEIREQACAGLQRLGIALDPEKNADPSGGLREIQSTESSVKVLVIPTNEELEIARQTLEVLQAGK